MRGVYQIEFEMRGLLGVAPRICPAPYRSLSRVQILGGVLSRCGLAGTGHQGFLDIAEGEPGEVDLLRRWLGEVGFLGGPPG